MLLFTDKKANYSQTTFWKQILFGYISHVYGLIAGSQIIPDETLNWLKIKQINKEKDPMFIDGANTEYPIMAQNKMGGCK